MRLLTVHANTDQNDSANDAFYALDEDGVSAPFNGIFRPLIPAHSIVLSEPLVIALELTAHEPSRMAPSQHGVALPLRPLLVVGHYARQAGRVEQRLIRRRDVDKRGAFGGSQRVSEDIANDPGMFAGEMVEGEALFLFGQFRQVARGCWERAEHLVGCLRVRVGHGGRVVGGWL